MSPLAGKSESFNSGSCCKQYPSKFPEAKTNSRVDAPRVHSGNNRQGVPPVEKNSISRAESPYFKTPPTSPSIVSSPCSRFFTRSTSSVYGSVESLGSLILTWVPDSVRANINRAPQSYCCRAKDSLEVCAPCRLVVQAAAEHFRSCPFFAEPETIMVIGGRELDSKKFLSRDLPCYEIVGRSMESNVRHLCHRQCYMRAYAPRRDWWGLRQLAALQCEEIGFSQALDDWTCSLVNEPDTAVERSVEITIDRHEPQSENGIFQSEVERSCTRRILPRTMFVNNSSEKRCQSANQTLRELTKACPLNQKSAPATGRPAKRVRREKYLLASIADHFGVFPPMHECASPLGLLEELFCENPWQLLLSAILLNRTRRIQVDAAFHSFLSKWPTPAALLAMHKRDPDLLELTTMIACLGIKHRRAHGIIRFTREYLSLIEQKTLQQKRSISTGQPSGLTETTSWKKASFGLDRQDILSLYYCGEYCADAYEIFIRKNWATVSPTDHALRGFVEWKRSLKRRSVCLD